MKKFWSISIVALVVFLMACGQQDLPVATATPDDTAIEDSLEEALFSDADIDAALDEIFSLDEDIDVGDPDVIPDGEETELPDSEALSTQATLAGATGYIYYIQHNPNSRVPWRIYRHDQATNRRALLYATTREIQSIAGSANGQIFTFAMRERASSRSDFEVYRATVSPKRITRLSNNKIDDLDVSMSANARRIAWQTERAGKAILRYITYEATGIRGKYVVSSVPLVEPTLSGNGKYLAFIQQQVTNRVMLHNIGVNFRVVTSSRLALHDPSPSDNGRYVAWLQQGSPMLVKVKDLSTNRIRVVARASTIEHPHLKPDGRWLTYGTLYRNSLDVYSKNLGTGATSRVTASRNPVNHYGMYWQGTRAVGGLADLVITRASIALGEVCEPHNPILYVTATIKNIGTAASPERMDVGLINAMDAAGSGWGNGIGLPAINPGQSTTTTFPIYYLIADPDYMVGTHNFDLKANRGSWIDELDENNNGYAPLGITIPADFCPATAGQPTHGRSWGDPHFITFDGLAYEFQTVGTFQLVETPSQDLNVQVCQKAWGSSNRVSVNKAVAMMIAGWRVIFSVDGAHELMINGRDASFNSGTSRIGDNYIRRAGAGTPYTIEFESGDEMRIEMRSGYMNIDYYAGAARSGAIVGLFGNANGDRTDDIALRDGTVFAHPVSYGDLQGAYADSWRVQDANSIFEQDDYSCPADYDFPSIYSSPNDLDEQTRLRAERICRAAGVAEANLAACILDVGTTGDDSFAEAAADSPIPEEELVVETTLPNPVLSYLGSEEYTVRGNTFVRFNLKVENWQDYPNGLFEAAPHLAPCGSNANAARAWVNIHNATNNNYIYGFCALGQSSDLQTLWFAVKKGDVPPSVVYITIKDRQEGNDYNSNRVRIPYTAITSYSVDPASPATLFFGDRVNIKFDYASNQASQLRIFVRPMTGGSTSPNYGAHGSPSHTGPTGNGTGFFTLNSGTGNVVVNQLRFQVYNDDQSVLLHEYFVSVNYTFRNPSFSVNDVCEGVSPDFKNLAVSYTSTMVYVDISFCSKSDIANAGDFVYLYGTYNHVINISSTNFELRKDAGADGHFEESVYSGSITMPNSTTLRVAIPIKHLSDIKTKEVWAYSMTSRDRAPNTGRLIIN